MVDLETFLKVFVFFQERSVVDDDLSVGNSEFQNLVVNCFRSFHGPNGLLEINVE